MAKKPSTRAANPGMGLFVASKTPRYYAAGIAEAFTQEGRIVPLADLSDEQEEELRNEPNLIVLDKDIAEAAPAPAAT